MTTDEEWQAMTQAQKMEWLFRAALAADANDRGLRRQLGALSARVEALERQLPPQD